MTDAEPEDRYIWYGYADEHLIKENIANNPLFLLYARQDLNLRPTDS